MMGGIEAVAVFFGILSVVMVVRQNIWCWPFGLVQVTLYVYIFLEVKLYSDLILHIVYIILQIYGWHHWLHGGRNDTELEVSQLDYRGRLVWPVCALVGTALWGYGMATFTDASLPYGDAFTTVTSLVAQWLMARKRIENWLFWIAVDVVAIGIYWQKELVLTSGLYAIFLGLSVVGWFAWRKSFAKPVDQEVAV